MIAQPPPLDVYLASASPRRRELLATIGVHFDCLTTNIDETPLADEPPRDYVARLALAKARAGQASLNGQNNSPAPVLGADTTVVIDAKILGKPVDRTQGLAMLAMLSGRQHEVYTGIALVDGARQARRVNVSKVRFGEISEKQRQAYWASGEPADKAGGYGIQALGAVFVEKLHGSHSGVMGLPLYETAELLANFGIDIWRQS